MEEGLTPLAEITLEGEIVQYKDILYFIINSLNVSLYDIITENDPCILKYFNSLKKIIPDVHHIENKDLEFLYNYKVEENSFREMVLTCMHLIMMPKHNFIYFMEKYKGLAINLKVFYHYMWHLDVNNPQKLCKTCK